MQVQIPEDYPNGALITCIPVIDPDYGENGRVTYTLFASDLTSVIPFRIQPDTGCIFLNSKQPLDYETRAFYNLTVKVVILLLSEHLLFNLANVTVSMIFIIGCLKLVSTFFKTSSLFSGGRQRPTKTVFIVQFDCSADRR